MRRSRSLPVVSGVPAPIVRGPADRWRRQRQGLGCSRSRITPPGVMLAGREPCECRPHGRARGHPPRRTDPRRGREVRVSSIPSTTTAAIRTPRAAAVAGIVFSVLFAASVVLLEWALPSGSRDAGTWVEDDGRRRAVTVSLQLLPFAGIAFLWFIGVLRDRIGAGEDRFF